MLLIVVFVTGSVIGRVPQRAKPKTSLFKEKAKRTTKSSDCRGELPVQEQRSSAVVLKPTADASVQTDHYDVVKELKEQIQNLTEVVRQLTTVKRTDQQEQKTPSSPFFEDDLDTAMDITTSFRRDPTPRPPQESPSTVLASRVIQTQVQTMMTRNCRLFTFLQ